MPPHRLYLSRYLNQPRPYPLAPPPPPSTEPHPDAHSHPIYCDAPKQRCTSLACRHSNWTRDHPAFVEYRVYQASSHLACITNLPERLRGKVAGLIQFEGFYRPLAGNRYKQVAPSGYHKLIMKYGAEILDNMLCLCALDPSIPTCGARARVIDRTAEGEGWFLACHRVPKVVEGKLDYTNTCGMFMRIHSYRMNPVAVSAEDVPQFAIRLGTPIPAKASAGKNRRKSGTAASRAKALTSDEA